MPGSNVDTAGQARFDLERVHLEPLTRNFSIPVRWDRGYIDEVLSFEQSHARISNFYGVVEHPVSRNGRVPLEHQRVAAESARELIAHIHARGRRFKYLLNAPDPLRPKVTEDDEVALIRFLAEELEVDDVVVSSPRLMRLVREAAPRLEIHVSTIAGVGNLEQLQPFLPMKPALVVPQHDVPKKPRALSALQAGCEEAGMAVEVMVTESCLFGCPWMKGHYQALSESMDDRDFHRKCRDERLANPAELLACGSFIRPEDVDHYVSLGVRRFKISGRSKSAEWLLRAARAYLGGKYDGNLVDLMGMDPVARPETWMRVDSAALDGLIPALFSDPDQDPRALAEAYYRRALAIGQIELGAWPELDVARK